MRNAKVKITDEQFLPVPAGLQIRYQHLYSEGVPKRLLATEAWLVDENTWYSIPGSLCVAYVNPKDTAVKRLGRLIAHNRCIKRYLDAHS